MMTVAISRELLDGLSWLAGPPRVVSIQPVARRLCLNVSAPGLRTRKPLHSLAAVAPWRHFLVNRD